MRSCVYCKRRYKKNSQTSFHRFPNDLEERKVWLQNLKITNWTPKTYDSLCSLHFTDECFDKHFNRTTLKPGSIPTIFEEISTYPSSPTSSPRPLKSSSLPRSSTSSPRLSTSTSLASPPTTKSSSIGTISTKGKLFCLTYISSDNYEVTSTPNKARIEYGLLHDHRYEITPRSSKKVAQQTRRSLKLSKAKLKTLSQRVRRLKFKVANMKSVITDLIKKNKLSEECIKMLKRGKSLSHDKY